MSGKTTTKSEFSEMLNTKSIIVADFFAQWCPPCKIMSPIIDSFMQDSDLKNARIIKVDVDQEPALAGQFEIMSIPTFIIMKADGAGKYEILEKMMGAQDPLSFKSKIQSYL